MIKAILHVDSQQHGIKILISLLLILATLVCYWQVQHADFVNIDDTGYVTKNRRVQRGLTWEGLVWAFSFSEKEKTYWQPLTWLSHMLDCELYGLNPTGHHRTNLLFHVANSLLLFLVLNQMTGARWRSFFVAALFALHPLNVESVAWVSERKNVLSTFFWMLTLLIYVYYCRQQDHFRYLLALLVFALGLLAKPIIVTLPFVLLLLDYWPLRRIQFGQIKVDRYEKVSQPITGDMDSSIFHLLLEKVPFLMLSVISIYLSAFSLQHQGELISTESVSMKLRMANALVSYVSYMGKMVWPQNLAVLYPFPDALLPMWQVAGAGSLLFCMFVLVILTLKRMPYFSVGWLWYVGTLIPVIGLVQGGLWPAMADRFAYIPLIGLFIIIVWGASELGSNRPWQRGILAAGAVIVLSVLAVRTMIQVNHWENDLTLYKNAINIDDRNGLAYNNMGAALFVRGKTDQAVVHYKKALEIDPENDNAYSNLGLALVDKGKLDEAEKYYKKALRINPEHANAHCNLGILLLKRNRLQEAYVHFAEAIRIHPDFAKAYDYIGIILVHQGKFKGAEIFFSRAIHIAPDFAKARKHFEDNRKKLSNKRTLNGQ